MVNIVTNKGRIIFDKIDHCNTTMNHIVTQGYKKQLYHILDEIEMGGVNVGHFDGTTKD
jgi:hypothetical protein